MPVSVRRPIEELSDDLLATDLLISTEQREGRGIEVDKQQAI